MNDAELAAIWTGCEPEPRDIGYSFGSIVKLLMLTGQRRTEVAAMRWSELNLEAGTWELSGDRTKNEEPTLIPLSTLAVSVPQSVPKTNDTFVFPARGNERSHFSGYAKGKKALDARSILTGWLWRTGPFTICAGRSRQISAGGRYCHTSSSTS
ncbi:MAG: hypothetical protein E5Y56_33300 [Mesorhizobium sp.]|nr:MAG: hypothetical protein E5Y56_33300 [Mesorhizobium sp.]